MEKSIFKSIIVGVLLGAFVFFTGPLLFIVLLLKFIFTPFGMGRMNRPQFSHPAMMGGGGPISFAEKIRSLSDEDYAAMKSKMQNGHGFGCRTEKV